MIRKVIVHSRQAICQNLAELLGEDSNYFISIVDPAADNVFAGGHQRAITLRFDDVSPDMFETVERFEKICAEMESMGRPFQLFSASQAAEIVAFVRQLHAADAEVNLHVHCTLGVSRSGAIAIYAAKACNLDLADFAALNPQIHPNTLVLKMLSQATQAIATA